MADIIRDAQQWLAEQQKQHVSRSATYRRGSQSIDLVVIVCPAIDSLGSPFGGGQIRRNAKDFIVLAEDFEDMAPAQGGDLLDIDEASGTNRYQVVQPDEGSPVSEAVDAHGFQLRIHTKFLKAL